MRLIDADALIKQIESPYTEYPIMIKIRQAIKELINDVPTVEPKKGKWILPNDCVARYLDEWICSNCSHLISHRHNFCPNCGADMRGEEQ